MGTVLGGRRTAVKLVSEDRNPGSDPMLIRMTSYWMRKEMGLEENKKVVCANN